MFFLINISFLQIACNSYTFLGSWDEVIYKAFPVTSQIQGRREILYSGLKSHVIFMNFTSHSSLCLMFLVISLFLFCKVLALFVARTEGVTLVTRCEFLHISLEAVKSETNFCLHSVSQTVSNPLACMAQYIFLKSCSITDDKSFMCQKQVSSHTSAPSGVLYSLILGLCDLEKKKFLFDLSNRNVLGVQC